MVARTSIKIKANLEAQISDNLNHYFFNLMKQLTHLYKLYDNEPILKLVKGNRHTPMTNREFYRFISKVDVQ